MCYYFILNNSECKITKNICKSYPFILPFCFFQVNKACGEQQGVIKYLCGEADGHRCLGPPSDGKHIYSIYHQRTCFQPKCRLCIARSGDAIEVNVGYGCHEHRHSDDVERRDGLGEQGRFVGIYGEEELRKECHQYHTYGHDGK